MAENVTYSFDEEFKLSVQKMFISLLVFDKKWAAINGLDIVKPEYFDNRMLFNICKWIHSNYKRYKKIPTKEELKELAKDFVNNKALGVKEHSHYETYLEEIFKIPEDANLEFYKEKAVEFVRQVAWRQALSNAGNALSKGTYEEALAEFRKVLSIGSENDLGLVFSEVDTDSFLELLKESYDKGSMLKTGVPGWDMGLGGGFVKKNVHIIGAPPGGGKSRTMAYLTKQALTDFKKVIFITLELSEAETMANIYTAATGIGLHEMLDPNNRVEFTDKAAAFKNTYCDDLVVKFYKPNAVNADTIHNFIQRVIQYKEDNLGREWKPDVIFIDYMDKLLPTQKIKGNVYEDGGGVATDCKNLGVSFDCPVITGSQLGRFSWTLTGDTVVSMDSIAESAQKVHIAHSMTTVNFNKGEKEKGKARLFMAKSRSGRPGTLVWVDNNLGRCSVTECEPWDPVTLQGSTMFTIKDTNKK